MMSYRQYKPSLQEITNSDSINNSVTNGSSKRVRFAGKRGFPPGAANSSTSCRDSGGVTGTVLQVGATVAPAETEFGGLVGSSVVQRAARQRQAALRQAIGQEPLSSLCSSQQPSHPPVSGVSRRIHFTQNWTGGNKPTVNYKPPSGDQESLAARNQPRHAPWGDAEDDDCDDNDSSVLMSEEEDDDEDEESEDDQVALQLRKLRTMLPRHGGPPRRAQTIFRTDGSPTSGSRARIRQRHHQNANDVDQTNALLNLQMFDDAGVYDTIITKETLLRIRRDAWQPCIRCKSEVLPGPVGDFSLSYNVAWEIGRRGCVAFQRIPRRRVFFMLKRKYAVRLLTMDGTDTVSFLSIYKVRRASRPVKCAVFSAMDLLSAQWDPWEGALRLEYFERRDNVRWRLRKHQFKSIPWNFYEAIVVCLRELMVWRSISKLLSETRRMHLEHQQNGTKRGSRSSLIRIEAGGASHRDRNKSTAYYKPELNPAIMQIRLARQFLQGAAITQTNNETTTAAGGSAPTTTGLSRLGSRTGHRRASDPGLLSTVPLAAQASINTGSKWRRMSRLFSMGEKKHTASIDTVANGECVVQDDNPQAPTDWSFHTGGRSRIDEGNSGETDAKTDESKSGDDEQRTESSSVLLPPEGFDGEPESSSHSEGNS